MKVIVSHDIDHLTAWEHGFRDSILPKYLVRMHIECLKGKISLTEYFLRIKSLFTNQWNHIAELIDYNNSIGIPSHFFIGMERGVGLSYSNDQAFDIIKKYQSDLVKFGVHGIAYDNLPSMQLEFDRFMQNSSHKQFGMRMHYVRKTNDTMQWIAKSGYSFDSTEYAFEKPYKVGDMWEFPFQIMDSWIMEQGKRWQAVGLEEARTISLRQLEKAQQLDLPFLGIIFHDHYFSPAHKTWMNWYTWFMEYLKAQGFSFIHFDEAIKELEK